MSNKNRKPRALKINKNQASFGGELTFQLDSRLSVCFVLIQRVVGWIILPILDSIGPVGAYRFLFCFFDFHIV